MILPNADLRNRTKDSSFQAEKWGAAELCRRTAPKKSSNGHPGGVAIAVELA